MMKSILPGLIAALLAGSAAAPAEAHPCKDGLHHAHCAAPRHFSAHRAWSAHQAWRERIDAAERQAEISYVPYQYYYPPMPATLFDLPPNRDFLNYLRPLD